ncbi:nucleotide exchange factor GrpE [Pontibacillus yanchengensis]|uniref:Nucleotide exchange factor GrpE n=2 Tax=Pontibacillus yanchengensis TaxID=462910 RepID=A0ACC7VEX5_9BACI|nr:nucleotide exchange factor GrpE [Pontibacillus yanchengensis]MYL33416.1 nucleotide exchange factor GrpE [Pontibacillus yanchengensis]MYL53466.1 nucleotide exchange factor GrpE [Pontibacillus yanchengensis]
MDENKQKSEEMEDQENVEQEEVIDHPEQEVVEDTNPASNEVEQLRQEKDETYQRLLRLQADYDNFRRRSQKEREDDLKYKSQDLVEELLPIVDNFERALQTEVQDDSAKSFVEGINMVYRQLKDALNKQGVEEIPAVGEEFDPNMHQAVMQVNDENYESNVVVEELQKGYKLKDRVIRPSMVKVNQ